MTENKNVVEISVCMGSSCFARGNNQNIQIVKDYISQNKLDDKVLLKGNLCEGICKSGPNIKIDGEMHSGVDPNSLVDLLNFYCKRFIE